MKFFTQSVFLSNVFESCGLYIDLIKINLLHVEFIRETRSNRKHLKKAKAH